MPRRQRLMCRLATLDIEDMVEQSIVYLSYDKAVGITLFITRFIPVRCETIRKQEARFGGPPRIRLFFDTYENHAPRSAQHCSPVVFSPNGKSQLRPSVRP